jgi:Flp pilus assembly protein TadG
MRRRTLTTNRSAAHDARRGATTVELALVLPVLFLVVFGAFEFSRLNMLKHLASVAAYEGAREGIIIGATTADVQAQVNGVLAAGGIINANVTTTPATITTTTTEVQVDVSIPVAGNFWVLPSYASGAITGTCTLSTERQGG